DVATCCSGLLTSTPGLRARRLALPLATGTDSRSRIHPRGQASLTGPRNGAELPAGRDAELDEDLSQVPFDRVRADEQPGPDLLIRQSVAGQPGDLFFLRGELVTRADRVLAGLLTAADQLAPGAFGEREGTDPGERLIGRVQLLSGIHAAVG